MSTPVAGATVLSHGLSVQRGEGTYGPRILHDPTRYVCSWYGGGIVGDHQPVVSAAGTTLKRRLAFKRCFAFECCSPLRDHPLRASAESVDKSFPFTGATRNAARVCVLRTKASVAAAALRPTVVSLLTPVGAAVHSRSNISCRWCTCIRVLLGLTLHPQPRGESTSCSPGPSWESPSLWASSHSG